MHASRDRKPFCTSQRQHALSPPVKAQRLVDPRRHRHDGAAAQPMWQFRSSLLRIFPRRDLNEQIRLTDPASQISRPSASSPLWRRRYNGPASPGGARSTSEDTENVISSQTPRQKRHPRSEQEVDNYNAAPGRWRDRACRARRTTTSSTTRPARLPSRSTDRSGQSRSLDLRAAEVEISKSIETDQAPITDPPPSAPGKVRARFLIGYLLDSAREGCSPSSSEALRTLGHSDNESPHGRATPVLS